MFSFINCVNKGTVSANQLGFFVGNSAQPSNGIFLVDSPNYVNDRTDAAAIYVSGCRNEGVMLATLKCEPFLSVNSSHKFDAVNAQLLEAGDQVFYSGTMSRSNVRDMGLSVYNDQVQIIPSVENQEITTYGLNCAVSTSYKYASGESAGSWYFSLTEYVDADQAASRTFKYITKVMLDTDYDLTAPEGERYEEMAQAGVKYDQHGNEYILVALEDGTWAAVINSAQALDNFEDGDVMWCGSVPTYTLTVQNAMGQNIGAIKYSAPDIPQKEEEEEPDQGTSSFVPSDFRLEANAEYGISLSMTPPSDQDGIEESISFAYAADGQPVINRSLDKNVRSTMFLLEYSGLEAGSNEIVVDVTATPAGGGAETDAYKTSFAVTLQVSDLAAEALPDGASAQLTQVGDGSAVALSGLEENQIYEVQMLYSDSSVARVKIACTDENGALDCGSSDAAEPITGVRLVKLEFGQVEEDSASVTRQSYTGILPVQTESSQA